MFLINVLIFVTLISISNAGNYSFLTNLPLGEYKVIFHTLGPCESTRNHAMKFNLYLSKRSRNLTEVRGNMSSSVDFTDSIYADMNLASWSLRGGWKENFAVLKTTEACSNAKKLFGDSWSTVLNAFNIPYKDCPLFKGTYVTSGFDINELRKNNFPKTFFYGKFKGIVKARSKEGNLLGCFTSELSLLRPWEKHV